MKHKASDKEILFRLKESDRNAFMAAYDKYIEDIYRFVYFKVSNHDEAEDLTSQVFLKVWNYIQTNSMGEYKTLKSFLYKVARNLVIDYYRKNANKNEFSLSDEAAPIDIKDEKQDPIGELELKYDIESLEKNLDKLKTEYREVIIMRYINELDIAEIALILEKSKGNVRVLIFRALKALREISAWRLT